MTTKVSLGTVSHGTMRNEDLIPCFVDLLSDLNEQRSLDCKAGDDLAAVAEFTRLDDMLGDIERRQEREDYYDSEDASEDCNELFDELNAFAPPYCYFGAHPGDGSDYGFWLSEDAIENARADGDALFVDDTSDVPADYTGEVFHVNDHGNCTLYTANKGQLTEVWAIV